MPVEVFGLRFAAGESARCNGFGQGARLCLHGLIAAESALDCVFGGHGKSLWVTLVLDQIRLIKTDVRAFVKSGGAGQRAGNDAQQSFAERVAIVGKVPNELSRRGEDSDAIRSSK